MKRYCSRRGCFRQHEEEDMLCVSGDGGKVKLYFCRDTNCYGRTLKKKMVRTAFNKNVYSRNFRRYV